MNFDLPPDIEAMCTALTAFARRDLNGPAHDFDSTDFRRRWLLAGKQGILGATVPEEYGGSGLDAVAAVALFEALGSGCADTGFAFSAAAHLFACLMPLVEFGTAEQQHRHLPRLCSGELVAAHAITESDAGSDILHQRTRADRTAAGYVLNGTKVFTTNSPVADTFLVQAVTQPGGGFFGLTAFLVPADAPGLRVGPPYAKLGLRGSPTAEVHFTDCPVPLDAVLGGEGCGASVFTGSMRWERICLFAVYLGAMRRVLDDTIDFVRDRVQFGSPIGEFQAVSHRVVDMITRLESARLLLFKAAADLSAGRDCEVSSGVAKVAVSEAAVQLGLDAIQLRGALGVTDGVAETLLRDALPARIFSGTNEIQKNNVARALGLGRRRPTR
ncbi:acyl-CoA dehydrogenase family protein [Nocardia sp. 2]|uniref:Acyl-CoA dehydrogenase family protein n=1 Tax=Nocardia acididurans TaxID=2802282 RepID=A0ABS1M6X8_9NOCA|nr:L-prolyl-[peptidyl-carrier protein] dehydrogenase [Nocardia acididurans]MBL1075895.1 acyl-CoA dehydrogenase family protein [Nocardia acididurans]